MKKMKQLLPMLLLLIGLTMGCAYDDTFLPNEVEEIKAELKQMKEQISSAQTVIDFRDKSDFNCFSIGRFDYETDTFVPGFVVTPYNCYGYMGEDPYTGKLWVGTTEEYVNTTMRVYGDRGAANSPKEYYYPGREGTSPAGVDFYYRFTKEWIDK